MRYDRIRKQLINLKIPLSLYHKKMSSLYCSIFRLKIMSLNIDTKSYFIVSIYTKLIKIYLNIQIKIKLWNRIKLGFLY